MNFLWPAALWGLPVLPLLALPYAWMVGRRRRSALSYSNLGLIKQALGRGSWTRHLPPALLLAAFTSLVFASARPTWGFRTPVEEETIVLAMDVSLSMRAKDVSPDRISASQQAARAFVQELPGNVRIGVVSYAGAAQLVQPPTTDKQRVVEAINRFQLQRGTAIGNGIAVALATIFPDGGIDVSQLDTPPGTEHARASIEDRPKASTAVPVPPGSYASAAIVLLTDGQNLMGFDPMAAAQMAADRGIRIFTVGVGTKDGEVLDLGGWKMRVRLDEDTLQRISNLTLGKYFHAATANELGAIYRELSGRLVFEGRQEEITVVFALLAGMLMLLAVALSMWWFGRLV